MFGQVFIKDGSPLIKRDDDDIFWVSERQPTACGKCNTHLFSVCIVVAVVVDLNVQFRQHTAVVSPHRQQPVVVPSRLFCHLFWLTEKLVQILRQSSGESAIESTGSSSLSSSVHLERKGSVHLCV